jgi:hypothetical protein
VVRNLTLFVEQRNETTASSLKCVTDSPAPDGVIAGRFVDASKNELLPFLGPSLEGKVYTFVPGCRYRVTELTAEGFFKLVPFSR